MGGSSGLQSPREGLRVPEARVSHLAPLLGGGANLLHQHSVQALPGHRDLKLSQITSPPTPGGFKLQDREFLLCLNSNEPD